MSKNETPTKVIVPCRFSYLHCWEPEAINGGEPKYSVSAIIPKSDKETIKKIQAAVEAAKQESLSKWGGKIPPNLKLPLRDGDIDRPEDEAYKGCYFFNANSRQAPQVVDKQVQPILDQTEVYSGCYGRISVKLADLIQDLQDSDFDVGFTGFEPPEIEQLFSKVHDKKVKEDDFNVEAELKKPTVAQTGDVWLLGKHRVICGDSILPETYNILMDGRKANLILTDPPYNVDVEETAGKIKNDNMADEDFYKFLFAAFVNMEQNMEDDASIYVFHADTEGLNFRKAFADAGFKLSGCCIWKKNALVLGRSPYQWQHEPCLFGWKKGGKHQWYSDRKQTTIWEYDRPKASKDHPTMKPIALMAYPVQNSSMMGCVVLDPFLGSGSTLMACEQTGRICYGVELEEKFVDVIVNRYMEMKGSADEVFVIRNNVKIPYWDLGKEGEANATADLP